MIYVVEVSHVDPPLAWCAADAEAFFTMVDGVRPAHNGFIYGHATPWELLMTFAGVTLSQATMAQIAEADALWILDLATAYGLYTPLFRADYVRLNGWAPSPVDKFAAYVAALTDGLGWCAVFRSERAAYGALTDAPLWLGYNGTEAWSALRELITSPRPHIFPLTAARHSARRK